jgi:hypothetical protein
VVRAFELLIAGKVIISKLTNNLAKVDDKARAIL